MANCDGASDTELTSAVSRRRADTPDAFQVPMEEFHGRDGVFMVYRNQRSVICSYDRESIARIYCPSCDALFCRECDAVLHRNPEWKKQPHTGRIDVQPDQPLFEVTSAAEFAQDYNRIEEIRTDPATSFMCKKRLDTLELRFRLYRLLNGRLEKAAIKSMPKVDVYNVVKVWIRRLLLLLKIVDAFTVIW